MTRTLGEPGPVIDVERAGMAEADDVPPWSRNWSPGPPNMVSVDPLVHVHEQCAPRRRPGVIVGACAVILLVVAGAVFTLNELRDRGIGMGAPVAVPPVATSAGSPDPSAAVPEFSARVARTDSGVTATAAIGLNSVRSRGVFYVVEVRVTNNGSAAAKLAYPRQRLVAYGQPFVADRTATSYLNGSPAMTIPPTGHPVVVRLAFDIPAGWRPDAMTLTLADRGNASVELPLP